MAFCVQSNSGQGNTGGAALHPTESSTASPGESRGKGENGGGSCGRRKLELFLMKIWHLTNFWKVEK